MRLISSKRQLWLAGLMMFLALAFIATGVHAETSFTSIIGILLLVATAIGLYASLYAKVKRQHHADSKNWDTVSHAQQIGDHLPGGIVYQIITNLDGENKQFTHISAGCETLLGVTTKMALRNARAIYDLILDEDRDELAKLETSCALNMCPLETEVRFRHAKNQSILHFLIKSAPLKHGENQLRWDGIALDISEQYKLRAEARSHEERFRLLFNEMLGGFALHEVICNPEGQPVDYRFLMINPAYQKITGLEADKIIGKTLSEIMPNAEPFWVKIFGNVAISGKPIYFESYAQAIDKFVAISAFCPQPGQFACILQDVTERKKAEKALIESEQRYEQLAIQSRTFSWENNMEGLYTYVSPVVKMVIGYEPEELVGKKHFYDLCPEEDRQALKQQAANFLADGTPFQNYENRMITKSGEIIWVATSGVPVRNTKGQIVGIWGSDTDITARKAAQEGMARLAAGVEQAAEAVIITSPKGIIEYVNPAFSTVTGYQRKEAIGKNPNILKSGMHDHALYDDMWNTLHAGSVWRGRLTNKRKDGKLYTQDTTISPVRDQEGNLVNYVAVTHDITETLALQEQLLQSQKMESVGRLAGGIAHDFNNMLMGILGYAEIAQEKLEDDHPAREDLDVILETAGRTAALTKQLLTFARKQTIQPITLNLNQNIPTTLKMLRHLIGESVKLNWTPSEDLWPVLMDTGQVDQILANLCVNARDAIKHDRGVISIATHNVHIDDLYCKTITDAEPGDYVCCSVSDNGCGIPEEMLQKIFDPFFTTKGVGEGTGLGLATVYGILKQNHGFISVYSEEEIGTTFKIYFPRNRKIATKAEEAAPKQTCNGKGMTILLVEDEENVLTITERFLKRMQFNVLTAADPHTAINITNTYKGSIDLLLTDMVMPGMNGKYMAATIRTQRPDIKVIFMSGYTSDMIIQLHDNKEGGLFLSKPFSSEDLTQKLQQAMGLNPVSA